MAKRASSINGYAKGENKGGEIIAEFVYMDKDGKPFSRVEKTEHGQFPQSHWVEGDPGEDSGWVPNAPKKGTMLPYYLPQLLKAKPETPVWICEGEKDADTVFNMGLVATTNVGGAGKWWPELNQYFKGKKLVYILEDNDEPGYLHAQAVAKAMHKVGVEKIVIVHFPDIKEGEDVTDWVEKYGGDKAKLIRRAEASAVVKDLPVITITAHNLPHVATQLEKALLDSKQPILNRGSQLVRPIFNHWNTISAKGKARVTQTTELHSITEIELHDIARKHACIFTKWDGRAKAEVQCPPTTPLLQMVLSRASHSKFPKVRGCINAPTLRPDGSVLSEAGHDKATGLWHYKHDAAALPEDMPKKPTKADAEKALAVLVELMKEVPFTDPKLDRAVALAAILTAVCRGGFANAPMFLFTAPSSGTGKSYMVDIISHIVQGTWCNVVNLSGPKEEREKRIGAILLNGTSMISMDNLENDLNDIVLNQMLTQPTVSVRVLGKSEVVKCEWRGTIFGTGNNVQLVGDLIRRGLTCNLNARMARPETKQFKFDPIDLIMDNRGKYLAAALTIARAYHFAKGEKKQPPLVSFEGWSHYVKDALIWLGEADVLKSMEVARRKDPQTKAAEEFVALWASGEVLKPGVAYRATEIIKQAEEAMAKPAMRDLLLANAPASGGRQVIDARRLGWWLRSLADQVHAGHLITVAKESTAGNGWVLLNATST